MVFLRGAIAFVACEHEHVGLVALLYRAHHGDAVHDAAVKHGNAVHHNDAAHVGQTARSHGDVDKPVAVMLFGQVAGRAGEAVCGDHLEFVGIVEICVVVIRQELVGEVFVEKLAVDYAAL